MAESLDTVNASASEGYVEDPVLLGVSTPRLLKEMKARPTDERLVEISGLLIRRSEVERDELPRVGEAIKAGLRHALVTRDPQLLERVLERMQEIVHFGPSGRRSKSEIRLEELEGKRNDIAVKDLLDEKPPSPLDAHMVIVGGGTHGERIYINRNARTIRMGGDVKYGHEYRKNFARLFGVEIDPDAQNAYDGDFITSYS